MKTIIVKTNQKRQVVDITDRLNQLIGRQDVSEGICVLFLTHTTAALTTADLDPGTDLDLLDVLDQLVPKLKFRHPHDPSHVPDHILSSLTGTSLTVPIKNGALVLGTWQRVVLIEFNGPKTREVLLRSLHD